MRNKGINWNTNNGLKNYISSLFLYYFIIMTIFSNVLQFVIPMETFWNEDKISFFNRLSVFRFIHFSICFSHLIGFTKSTKSTISVYIYIYIYIYICMYILWQCMVVTVSLGGFMADQIQYDLECAPYLCQMIVVKRQREISGHR